MAPAITVPEALSRSGLELEDMVLIEIHDAFGAQVLANAAAWEQGGKQRRRAQWMGTKSMSTEARSPSATRGLRPEDAS